MTIVICYPENFYKLCLIHGSISNILNFDEKRGTHRNDATQLKESELILKPVSSCVIRVLIAEITAYFKFNEAIS